MRPNLPRVAQPQANCEYNASDDRVVALSQPIILGSFSQRSVDGTWIYWEGEFQQAELWVRQYRRSNVRWKSDKDHKYLKQTIDANLYGTWTCNYRFRGSMVARTTGAYKAKHTTTAQHPNNIIGRSF
jgi:hypothetical protein